jgi:glucose-6-phosphate 1-dehydrogenase
MGSSTTIVIFGASGDLTGRKLIPSLFNLYCKERLPENCRIVGVARRPWDDEKFRSDMEADLKKFTPKKYNAETWAEFAPTLYYHPGDLTVFEDIESLKERLRELEGEGDGEINRIYYLAIAPKLYEASIQNLGHAGLVDESSGWRRVVIEKPFGHDLPSAKALNAFVHRTLQESQIYRIDHYLGKETVQNILVFRFANSLFEPVWNRNYIDHVQITASEEVDIGHRAGYYDGVGVMRDMMQNHMLQLLSLVAMEPPSSFEADPLRNEKVKVLSSVRPIHPFESAKHTVRGQYKGYLDAEGVAPDSETATYAAVRLLVDNWRWQGVPFYLRSGKALKGKVSEISIVFKRPPHLMFPSPEDMELEANDLSICIQPDEGIHFSFQAKVPDTAAEMRNVDMTFQYEDSFGEVAIPDAYERLLLDVLKGDASLFTRGDSIELAWGLVDQILEGWDSDDAPPLVTYEPGTWGPSEADALVAHDGFTWRLSCTRD